MIYGPLVLIFIVVLLLIGMAIFALIQVGFINYAFSKIGITGTLSTLIGADLLNLGKIRNLGAPVVSIGGSGTFDGIFITGIIAVILASF